MKSLYIRKHSLIIRYILSYILILIIPLALEFFIYYKTVNMVEEDAKEANLASLDQIAQNVDKRISEIDLIVQRQLQNTRIQSFQLKVNPYEYPNLYSIIETRNSIGSFLASNSFILDYFFLFNKSNLVLGRDLTYTYEQFYRDIFNIDNTSFQQWKDSVCSAKYKNSFFPAVSGNYRGKHRYVLTYRQSFSMMYPENGSMLVVINNDEIRNLLNRLRISRDGWAYVTDANGNLLSSTEDDNNILRVDGEATGERVVWKKNVKGSNMLISCIISKSNGFRYVSVQPETVVLTKVQYIKNIIYVTLAASILCGILLSIYLAYRNTRPLMGIFRDISRHFTSEEKIVVQDLSAIRGMVTNLLGSNDDLKAAIDIQKPFLSAAFLRQLLNGEFNTREEFLHIAPYIGIPTNNGGYLVAIIQLGGSKVLQVGELPTEDDWIEMNGIKLIIKEITSTFLANRVSILDIAEDKLALLLSDCPTDPEEVSSLADGLIGQLREGIPPQYFNQIRIGGGNPYAQMVDASRSFEEARIALNSIAANEQGSITWYRDTEKREESYYFPAGVQTKLMNAVKTGNSQEIHSQLELLYKENIINRNLPENIMKLFIYNLWANIMQILQQSSFDDTVYDEVTELYDQLEHASDVQKIKLTTKGYQQLCSSFHKKKEVQNEKFLESILDYINRNYTDPNLSLNSVAEVHNISEAYLSHLFKQQTGENYSVYIEKLRMQKAMDLIRETVLTIQEISQKVGYYSSNTFCRAFKRVNGISATTYRTTQNG